MRSLSTIPTTRRGVALIALGSAVSLLIGLANPAAAASTVTTTGENRLGEVFGTVSGKSLSPPAGLIGVDTDGNGSTDAWAYCIDLATRLVTGTYTEGSWDEATVPGLGRIAWVLHHYPAAPDTTTEMAMAVQAAVWHFSDGFELTVGPGGNSEAVEDVYSYIVAKAATIPEPRPTLTVTPRVQETEAGAGLVYGVRSTAPGPVTLSLRDGPIGATFRRVHGDGACDLESPPITAVALVDGAGEVCLFAPVAGGPVTLAAVVTQATAIGRVFLMSGSQKLVFAGGGTVSARADATATWTERPITTTTTATTTAPPSLRPTTEPPSPPSTTAPPAVPVAPAASPPAAPAVLGAVRTPSEPAPVPLGALPRTGVDARRSVVLALGLLCTGSGLFAIARGRRSG